MQFTSDLVICDWCGSVIKNTESVPITDILPALPEGSGDVARLVFHKSCLPELNRWLAEKINQRHRKIYDLTWENTPLDVRK